MMDKETWMTGKEAKELGFVDEVLFEDVPVAAHGGVLIVNGVRHDMSKLSVPLPKIIDGVSPENVSMETADEDEPWEAPNLEDFTDKSWDELTDTEKRRIAGHFAWAASMPPEKYGDLKFPSGQVMASGMARRSKTQRQAEQSKLPNTFTGRNYLKAPRHGQTPPGRTSQIKKKRAKIVMQKWIIRCFADLPQK